MKVLQINATYGYGSTGLIMQDIGDMLRRTGNEALYAYQTAGRAVESGYQVGNKLDWNLHALLCRLLGGQGYYSSGATKVFLFYLDTVKPDVVHLHNLHSNYVHLNQLLDHLARRNIPTVITMHDCWYFTGKCFHYVDVDCDRFQSGCGNCPKRKAPPASLFFDRSSQVLKDRYTYLSRIPRLKIVGCSQWVCEEARRGIMKDFDICNIYNGVDTQVFHPYDKSLLKRGNGLDGVYLIMGMANKWLLPENRAVLEETVRHLDTDTKLMLVGCNDAQRKALQRYENVLAVGFVRDRVQLAQLYSMADVFVNVTHADTLPTVNMESICCGTPVVTYNSCGSPEMVGPGCGFVVPENDIAALLQAIQRARGSDWSECARYGQAAFDKNVCYEKYLDVYRDAIKMDVKM